MKAKYKLKISKIMNSIMPRSIIKFLKNLRKLFRKYISKYKVRFYRIKNKYTEKKLKTKAKDQKLNIYFYPIYNSIWKYDDVLRLFLSDTRFNVSIIVMPIEIGTEEEKDKQLAISYDYFKHKASRVYKYNSSKARKNYSEFSPDIEFYTRPYKNYFFKRYNPALIRSSLHCYVNYGYGQSNIENDINNLAIPTLAWRYFLEAPFHLRSLETNSYSKGKNGLVTGYPGTDSIRYNQSNIKKIVVWAPHHSIEEEGWINTSTFLRYHEVMLKIAEKYENYLHFVFKPHPLLFTKLNSLNDWGYKRTKEYYSRWENGKNTSLEQGDYINVFNLSTALIHDCSSFTVEYLYTGKPALYLMKDDTEKNFNKIGKKSLDLHYHAYDHEDITIFINDTVIHEMDYKKDEREHFYFNELRIGNNSASENIYNYICDFFFEEE